MRLLSVAEISPAFDLTGMRVDGEGFNSDHALFGELIAKVQPKVIIEVGSWKGASALHMAELTASMGTRIFCVDTWQGTAALREEDRHDDSKPAANYAIDALYKQFLFNVAATPHAGRIYPIPQTSINGVRILSYFGIRGDLVYIDGGHAYDECYLDLKYYASVVSPTGIMFGDDYRDFRGVRIAVERFAIENGLDVLTSGPAWVLQPQ